MNARETFLQRVRQAVVDGNKTGKHHSGALPRLPERGVLGIKARATIRWLVFVRS